VVVPNRDIMASNPRPLAGVLFSDLASGCAGLRVLAHLSCFDSLFRRVLLFSGRANPLLFLLREDFFFLFSGDALLSLSALLSIVFFNIAFDDATLIPYSSFQILVICGPSPSPSDDCRRL